MGLATAGLAAEQGAEVTIAAPDELGVQRAAAQIAGTAAEVCDAERPAFVARMLTQLAPHHVVVAVPARADTSAGAITGTSLDAAQAAFARLWISYNVVHAAPGRVDRCGSVTLVSGSSARWPVAGLGVWGTSHGSIEALARSAALELSPIRVNVVSPGGIGTAMDRQLVDHPGQPADVAAMIIALMANPAITGTGSAVEIRWFASRKRQIWRDQDQAFTSSALTGAIPWPRPAVGGPKTQPGTRAAGAPAGAWYSRPRHRRVPERSRQPRPPVRAAAGRGGGARAPVLAPR